MQIRLLKEQDIESWKSLRLQALKIAPASLQGAYEEEILFSSAQWERNFKNQNIFGAFIENTLAGIANFSTLQGEKVKHRAVLSGIYTNPEYRGQGIASTILHNAISHAKSLQVAQLQLACITDNLAALKIYKKCGFRIYGTEPRTLKVQNQFLDAYLMILHLDSHQSL